MTLEEALRNYDWIQDPTIENRARIAGPDNLVAIIVEENDDLSLDCWLWCYKTGERVGSTVVHANTHDELEEVFSKLFVIRRSTGDCPTCGLPLGLVNHTPVCDCGYKPDL